MKAFESLNNILRRTRSDGLSLGFRLFGFISFLLLAVIAGFLLVMIHTGVFKSSEKEFSKLVENELTHLSNDVYSDFGKLSVQGIELAETFSNEIDSELKELGITASELSGNAEAIEKILSSRMGELILALKNAKSSGIFLMLDATLNDSLQNAQSSKAGVFLKCTEPNIVNSTNKNIRFLRGSTELALNNKLTLLPQWKMEFSVNENDFFHTTLDAAHDSTLPISRLYYWSDRVMLEGNSE